jgi:thymidine kinase
LRGRGRSGNVAVAERETGMAKLHFIYSVMNAGKSLALLGVWHNYTENGRNVLLVTSAVDDRDGMGVISSRLGLSREAVALRASDDLFAAVEALHRENEIGAVLMDEVQFMTPDHMRQAARIVDELGIPVMAYGLKNNAFGELFGPAIATLLALADESRELKTLCHCGRKATMILKYGPDGVAIKSGEVVEVGGDDRYVSVCRPHWNAGEIGAANRNRLLPRPAA